MSERVPTANRGANVEKYDVVDAPPRQHKLGQWTTGHSLAMSRTDETRPTPIENATMPASSTISASLNSLLIRSNSPASISRCSSANRSANSMASFSRAENSSHSSYRSTCAYSSSVSPRCVPDAARVSSQMSHSLI